MSDWDDADADLTLPGAEEKKVWSDEEEDEEEEEQVRKNGSGM